MEIDYDGLVISGSATKGFCALGYLDKNKDLLKGIKYYSGTSSGSIIICLLAAGYEPLEIYQAWEDDTSHFKTLDITLYSFFSMNSLLQSIEDKLRIKGIEYFEDFDKDVYVCATEFEGTAKAHYFSNKETPRVRVIDAIRASCAIPGIFPPAIIDGKMYVDGALKDNFPIDTIHYDANNILGINIVPTPKRPTTAIGMIVKSIGTLVSNTVQKEKCRKYVEIEVEEGLKIHNLFMRGRSY